MSSTKNVLPNFVKTLAIASLATISVSAFAGNLEEGEQKLTDLKEMNSNSKTLKAQELTSELDVSAESDLRADADKLMNENTVDLEAITEEAKPQL